MELQLNDDCLLHIFELLDFEDQINLVEVSQHFRYLIVCCLWSKKYRTIDTQMKCLQPLSIDHYKKFFHYNAENITKLVIEDTKPKHFAFTSYLNRFSNRPEFSFYFSLKMENLRELHCNDARLHNGYIQILARNCPLLAVLYSNSTHVTDTFVMEQFKMLRELKLGNRIIALQENCSNGSNETLCVC